MELPAVVVVGDPVLKRWGERIAHFRVAAGLSQQQLAAKLEVSHPTVWRWENGKMEPTRHHKKALAEALNTVEQVLFT